MNDETNSVQGSGPNFDEAFMDAHDKATQHSGGEMKRSKVFDISMTTGGFTGERTVYVRVHSVD